MRQARKERESKRSRAASTGEVPRAFTAEITFNGLVVMRIPDKKRPPPAAGVEILFVKTYGAGHDHGQHHGPDHRHYPRLTYYADDQLGLLPKSSSWPLDYDYYASPEGRQTVSVDLTNKLVEIIPFYSPRAQKELTLLWSDATAAGGGRFPDPNRPEDDQSLDWVLSAAVIGLEPAITDAAVTVIKPPPHGHWRTHGVYRNREVRTLDPIHWLVGTIEQALGRDLVLELKGLNFGLTLRISNLARSNPNPYDIVLTPAGDEQYQIVSTSEPNADHHKPASRGDYPESGRLKLALTNLPGSYTHADVSHVTMYGQLSRQRRHVQSPTQVDDVVCAQAACTPVKETGGGG